LTIISSIFQITKTKLQVQLLKSY